MANNYHYHRLYRKYSHYLPKFLFTTLTFITVNWDWILPNLARATVEITIENTATVSFEDPDQASNTRSVNSNTVTSKQTVLGSCLLGDGVPDSAITAYISDEVKNNNSASRQLTDALDDDWSQAVGVPSSGVIEPWFGRASSPGNVNSFRYFDPSISTSANTTVELVEIPIGSFADCQGITNASSSTPTLSTSNTLQSNSPRPTSLNNTTDQPAFWNQTTASSKDNRRFAVRFTFDQPVKSFGAWFGDLETRTTDGTPAILRLLDSFGNRIGNDIPIPPTNLYDGNAPDPEVVNQNECGNVDSNGFTAINIGCGNKSTRWVGFVDNSSTPRVSQVLVIVGDDDYNDDADTEILSFIGANIIVNLNPTVLLVKRITAINGNTTTNSGDDLSTYNQDDSDRYDDNELEGANPPIQSQEDTDKWPNTTGKTTSTFLIGGINGGQVDPEDEIEYTIYFLSAGDTEAKSVLFCDRVPTNTTFIPTAFNSETNKATGGLDTADRGIIWQYNNIIQSLTNVKDGDAGQYFAPGVDPTTVYPNINCGGENTNGAVVINLGNIPNATAPGVPTNSYGFFRFRGKVK